MSGITGKRPEVLDVAIVGGGIAGTYAAYRLRHANQRIGLFECSNRIGGRLFTYHLPSSPSINIELGAMRFFPQRHKIVSSLISELDLPVVPFPKTDSGKKPTTLYYLRGQHLTQEDILHGQIPYALDAGEKENQHRLWNYYLEKLLDINDERSLLERVEDPDVETKLRLLEFETALDLVSSPEGKAFVLDQGGLGTDALIRAKASAFLGFRSIARNLRQDVMTLKNGMSSLPLRLNKCFVESSKTHRTFLNHKLISIHKTEGKQYVLKFQLTLTEDDHTFPDTKDSVYETLARYVILALPVPALGSIQWKPFQEISLQWKRILIDNLNVCKIFFVFNYPWWKDCSKRPSITISDQIYTTSVDIGSQDGTFVLMATISLFTDTFRVLQSRGESIPCSAPGDMCVSTALKDFLLKQLSLTFEIPRSQIPDPIAGVAKFWESSVSGGVQFWKQGLLDKGLLDRIKQPTPMEDVVVVGTDVSAKHGFEEWTEGALRVVDEMLSRSPFMVSKHSA